jgi:hypothetical protein
MQEPFSVTSNNNFSQDHRIRVMLLVANVDLLPGDVWSVVTAEARWARTDLSLNRRVRRQDAELRVDNAGSSQITRRVPESQ